MNIKEITLAGNPILKRVSDPIENFSDPLLHQLILDLFDTMKAHQGAGLAAPQIGVSKRVIVYGFTHNPRYPKEKPIPDTVLINPEIIEYSRETEEYYEGCLSLTNLRGLVARSKSIVYKARLPSGEIIQKETEGFEARIIQHEIDHLDGILFPSKMKDMRSLAMYTEMLRQQPAV